MRKNSATILSPRSFINFKKTTKMEFYPHLFSGNLKVNNIMPERRLIIDVQRYKSDNNFIPKELVAYNGQEIIHYIFRIPFPLISLPPNIQRENKWFADNFHGLDWKEGFTHLSQCKNILFNLSEKADVIYVQGKEKQIIYENILEKKCIVKCTLLV